MTQEPSKASQAEDVLRNMGGGDDPSVQADQLQQLSQTHPPEAPADEESIASALANESAGQPKIGHLDALQALANGEDLGVEEPPAQVQSAPTSMHAAFTQGGSMAAPTASYNPTAAAQRMAKARQAQAHGFKHMAIPFLVVFGGLLIAMATLVLVLHLGGKLQMRPAPDAGAFTKMLYGPSRIAMIVISIPMGGTMLLAAWWFHREIKAARGK